MFEVLGDVFDSARVVQPRFDPESSLRVVRTAERVTLKDLKLIAEGLIRIEGEIEESQGGKLEGRLRVGVAESLMVLADTPAAASVFSDVEEGYHWGTIRVGGTIKEPKDSLREQVRGASEALSPATGGASSLEEEFRDLTSPGSD
jgi:hypothetical protein